MSDSIEKLRAAEARLMIAAPQPRQMTPDEREWRIEREIDCIRAGLAASRSDAAEAWKLRALEAEAKLAALVEAVHDTTLRCKFACNEDSNCGTCGSLFTAIRAAKEGA